MKTLALLDLERRIEKRKAELGLTGNDFVRVNSGARRSLSKRALLQRLRDIASEKGTPPKFRAKL